MKIMNISRLFLYFTAFATVAIAGLAILGWHLHIPQFVQWTPEAEPLHYNGAIGFLLFGLGLLCLIKKRYEWFALIAGVIIAVLGGVILAEYLFSVNRGIDQLFIQEFVHPGRVSPNAALSLLLEGITLSLFALSATHKQWWGTLFGTVVLCVGIISSIDGTFGLDVFPIIQMPVSIQARCLLSLQGLALIVLSLPQAAPQKAKETTQLQEIEPTVKKQQLRVLLCEDDLDFAFVLQKILQRENCLVDIAETGAQAKALVQENVYDFVTLDLHLPDHDGLTLAQEIRQMKNKAELPIVVISASADQQEAELRKVAPSIISCLNKPFPQENLKNILRDLRQGQSLAGPLRILYVEDDTAVFDLVSAIFKKEADIQRAETIHTAKLKLQEMSFDLVLLDLQLPDGSGIELLPCTDPKTRALIPTVVLSSIGVPAEYQHFVSYHFNKAKVSQEQLVSIIKTVANRT